MCGFKDSDFDNSESIIKMINEKIWRILIKDNFLSQISKYLNQS
jgi:hypothetical protein